MYSEDTNQLD